MLLSRPAPVPSSYPHLKRSVPSTSSNPPQLPPIKTVSAPLPPTRESGDGKEVREKEKEKEKKKEKGKLTEQWGPPPLIIVRDQEQLIRGSLLGEVSHLFPLYTSYLLLSSSYGSPVPSWPSSPAHLAHHSTRSDDPFPIFPLLQGGFARVYGATEPSGTKVALKVIAKEQLKSSSNKTKVRFLSSPPQLDGGIANGHFERNSCSPKSRFINLWIIRTW